MSSGLIIPGRDPRARDEIAGRMVAMGQAAQDEAPEDLPLIKDPWEPRWRLDTRWVEFECGCRAERVRQLRCVPKDSDPIIFRNLPEQAVYDEVCHRHGPGMNVLVSFDGFTTFDQWKRNRRHLLMGTTSNA